MKEVVEYFPKDRTFTKQQFCNQVRESMGRHLRDIILMKQRCFVMPDVGVWMKN